MNVGDRIRISAAIGLAFFCARLFAEEPATSPAQAIDLDAVMNSHPAATTLTNFFDGRLRDEFRGSSIKREDYLALVLGNVEYWRHFQDARGAIVDPFEGRERQYSTPAFALAAASLVANAGHDELLEPATRAMSWSLECLANKKTADRHADFYIPMVMHAHRLLKSRVPAETAKVWDEQLRSLIPHKSYTATRPAGNWNLVHVSGEWLRRKDGMVVADQLEPQRMYLESCINAQLRSLTGAGMYVDPNAPLAYDAFPRLWLEDMLADGAYDAGENRDELERALTLGGLSTLLLDSPSGEWASGGRSAHHQWNEAEVIVIAEINAARWFRAGRTDIAGAFRRVAHLSLESMRRWQRPTGEFWIVKNFADPARRFGFMGYSYNSQYNLLAAAMLTIAYERADDRIPESPAPSEAGSYVFDVREKFHHVVAACGGYYVLVDTSADLDHGSTGLQRVHRAGVALSPLTDSPSPRTVIGPRDEPTRLALTPGIEWREEDGEWRSLASYGTKTTPPVSKSATRASTQPVTKSSDDRGIREAILSEASSTPDRAAFVLRYNLNPKSVVQESYVVTAAGVEGSTIVSAHGPYRVVFPALVNDGARDTDVQIDGATLKITRHGAPGQPAATRSSKPRTGGTLVWRIVSPEGLKLARTGPQVVTHNGYVQAVTAELPGDVREVKWVLTLSPEESK